VVVSERDEQTEQGARLSDASLATLVGVYEFVQSPVGQQCIRRQLQQHRLPSALDADIESIVLYEAERTLRAGNPILVPGAWARQRIASRVVDVVRGRVRRAESYGREVELDRADVVVAETIASDDTAADRVREAVRRDLASAEWVGAAALTVLTRLLDGSPLVGSCPQPKAGADRVDAAHWAGLWYAGRTDCFDAPGVKPNTLVQKRAREVAKVKALLARAYNDADERGGDDG
jgi:hypothetical protein